MGAGVMTELPTTAIAGGDPRPFLPRGPPWSNAFRATAFGRARAEAITTSVMPPTTFSPSKPNTR